MEPLGAPPARVNQTITPRSPRLCTIGENVVDEYRCVAVLRSDCAMMTIQQDPTIVLDTGRSGWVYAVVFHPDGIHLLSGGDNGIQRWQLADGQEVGKQLEAGMAVGSICVSRDRKWVVRGTTKGASVWDAELREKVIDVEETNTVYAVDVSPDSTSFTTGIDHGASIWSIPSGERLVGPLKHDHWVTGIKFSPNGEHIATACFKSSIRVFDSRTGDWLITIDTITPEWAPIIPLLWSDDGQQIFAASKDNKVRCFQVSTGSQLAESQILNGGGNNIRSIALATNGKFLATHAGEVITFLDTSTLSQIVPVVKDSGMIASLALSSDSRYIATGQYDRKISVRSLGSILPDLYGPFHVSICQGLILSPTLTCMLAVYCRATTTSRTAFDLGQPR